ncbi:type IV pilus assembly protein PilC [Aequitasia blattaphilus]|uniref:Type II secretion system F family protein n=1 Tax=Aequitasia blattaphilus TaxID=2949332 RepID=A0ABT1E948_9FIRM|nr:type II secretion system F family protein [Aequitasia blattaphilus]MCP1102364.1 type II secretion system F family protein [Aequitasia blattaphilus]MCR8615004.1 type II secretion system F family protein [Aequitasia blattaphilus]
MKQQLVPLSNMELSAFCSQMSMILGAGISSIEGISLLLEESAHPSEKPLLLHIQKNLEESGSLYTALKSTKAFPHYMLQMVEIGEMTGTLDSVFGALGKHYEREASLTLSIRHAITYPLIMVVMLTVVILLLITKVMPIFNQVFKQLGSELTGISKAFLDLGLGINRYGFVLIGIVILLVLVILYFAKTQKGQQSIRTLTRKLPFFKNISNQIAAGRFASGMYLTLSSGLSPEESLEMTEKLMENPDFSKKIADCIQRVKNGEELSKALLSSHIFTGLYAKMTSIASKTGSLDDTMNDVAEKYNDEVDVKLTGLIAAIEPSLVIVLSLIVGVILLSVMLPLLGILSSI